MTQQTTRSIRIESDLRLRSVNLPSYSCQVNNISECGACVKLEGAVSPSLIQQKIRVGLSLPGQTGTFCDGYARIIWIRSSENGIEVGLKWEEMSWDFVRALSA